MKKAQTAGADTSTSPIELPSDDHVHDADRSAGGEMEFAWSVAEIS